MNLNKSDLFWLVGLFEGEGCFFLTRTNYKDKIFNYPGYCIEMNDEDIIAKAASLMGKTYIKTKKNTYRINSTGREAYVWIILFYPYLGLRRRSRIDEILKESTHDYTPITIVEDIEV